MTKFQFISELLNIINALLQADISGCTLAETREYLAELFAEFEEHEGLLTHGTSDRGDFEMYGYIIDGLYQNGFEIWSAEKATPAVEPEQKAPFCSTKFFEELNAMITLPFGGFESGVDFNAL